MKHGWGLKQNADGSIGSNETDDTLNVDGEKITLQGNYKSLDEEEEIEKGNESEKSFNNGINNQLDNESQNLNKNPYQEILQQLVDNDLIEYDEEKEFTGTPEEILESIRIKAKKEAENSFEEMISSLPKENAEIIRAIKNGVSLEEAYNLSQEFDYSSVDVSDLDNQANLVGAYLESLGESEESIERKIRAFHKSGILEEEANEAKRKLIERTESVKKEKIESARRQREENLLQIEKDSENFRNEILAKKEIAGFKITPNEAKSLHEFITKVDKDGKTELEKKDSDESRLLYAYFVMKGMDKNALTKEIKKTEAFKLQKKLDERNDNLAGFRNRNGGIDNNENFVDITEISNPFR